MSPSGFGAPKSFGGTLPHHILVVDDEPGFRALLSMELTKRGHRVVTAENGRDALEQCRRNEFQLVISDVKMPKMGGLEFLEALKKDSPSTEFIITTGYGTVETAVAAMKKGAYDFIQKPYNLPELLALVEKALEKGELRAMVGVYEASREVFKSVKLDTLLPAIMEWTVKILGADDASLMLVDDTGKLRLEASTGLTADQRRGVEIRLGEGVDGRAAQWREPVLISGPLWQDPRFADLRVVRDIKSSIVYPLVLEGELLGVLNANRTKREDPFSGSSLFSMTILGSQIAQAVYNARLYKKLEGHVEELKTAYADLRNTQAQLIQSEKMAALGVLSAGVGHELNNPLSAVIGMAQFLLEGGGLSAEQREDIEMILRQSQRCATIVQSLLDFSRKSEPRKIPTDLAGVVDCVLRLVRGDFLKEGLTIDAAYEPETPRVNADPDQLHQVFLNAATNARQAMEGRSGGVLTVTVGRDGNKACVVFRDTGAGIPPDIQAKIFDPFFTTKKPGQGTGLGLSISLGIVKEHQGEIRVAGRPGAGAEFRFLFPPLEEQTKAPEALRAS
ncbi:MAG TPA: response regulator [Elusimicrobiota bacterium]|nr:response regulator [Elusimicrobiota bacterium]HNA59463.1 response regulator [Elusimicrobiota bacterium]